MLACDCGWRGVNLIPNLEGDTARCPGCNTVFVGIPANDAVIVPHEEEQGIVYESDLLVAVCELLSPSRSQ